MLLLPPELLSGSPLKPTSVSFLYTQALLEHSLLSGVESAQAPLLLLLPRPGVNHLLKETWMFLMENVI